jgi:hypothetical protein
MTTIAKSGGPRWITRAIRRLVRLAEGWDIEVGFEELEGLSGIFIPEDMTIFIDSRVKGRDRVNYLLHEMGHASIHIDGLTRDRFNVFDEDAKTASERLTLVEEEFEAWHRGRMIARRAGIKLDESYEQAREKSMMSYLRWCVSDGHAKIGGRRNTDSNDAGAGHDTQAEREVVTDNRCELRVCASDPATSVEVDDARTLAGLSAGHAGVHGVAGLGPDSHAKLEGEAAADARPDGSGGVSLLKATVPEGVEEAGQGEAEGPRTTDANGQQPERPVGDAQQGSSTQGRRNALRLRGL